MIRQQPRSKLTDKLLPYTTRVRSGNMGSATQTINLLYGAGLVPPGTGVLLNDEMDDFALKPGTPNAFGVMGFEANAVVPGKRMLSSMTPTLMFSPKQITALGAPGGSRIITEEIGRAHV